MSDEQTQGAQTGTSGGGVDMEALGGKIAEAVSQQLGAALKPITDGLTALNDKVEAVAKPAAAEGEENQGEAMTADAVKKLVSESISAALTEHTTAQGKAAKRSAYLESKMADVPKAYRNLMPDTDDEAELKKAEQSIREQAKADGIQFKSATNEEANGGSDAAKNGSATSGAQKPSDVNEDLSKVSGVQLIEQGLAETTA